eukprot:m.334821 g.334821  ORF g.334821 m.334821 type:complete len:142 (-) comp20516_c2_seq3:1615-2040(-)
MRCIRCHSLQKETRACLHPTHDSVWAGARGETAASPCPHDSGLCHRRYYTSQSATVFLFLASMVLEMVQMAADPILLHGGEDGMWVTLAMSSFVAFFMNLCNFLVTFYTSAVTLSVLGNVKSVLVMLSKTSVLSMVLLTVL